MGNEEEHFKREDDRKWRESVQSRLVSLTDSELTQNDRLDEVDDEIHTLRAMLEGKADDKNDNGIKGDVHDLTVKYNELRALMMPDHLGQGGVINRLKALERREEKELQIGIEKWKFWVVLVGLIGTIAVAVISNLDRIETFLRRNDPVDQAIEKAKHPKGRKVYRVRVVPAEPADETE